MKTSSKNLRGFTLIELLVVIAIIAILAAILFPVFAQAKLAAKKATDLSNQKQITTSTFMYQNDVDDVFPMLRNGIAGWQSPVVSEQINSGHNALNPYVKNRSIWLSPNDTMLRCDSTSTGYISPTNQSVPTGGGISYVFSYNRQINLIGSNTTPSTEAYGIAGWSSTGTAGNALSSTSSGSVSTSNVGQPASTVWLMPMYISWSYWTGLMQHRADQRQYAFDPTAWSNGIASWPNVTAAPGAWCSNQDYLSMGNFGGVTNFGFADGHAKSMRREQLMDRMWITNEANAISSFAKNYIHIDERYK